MHRQQGFVMSKGLMYAIAFAVLVFIVILVTQSFATPPQNTQEANTEQQQAQTAPPTRDEIDTQIKEDLARVATAVNEYVANNSGGYPATNQEAGEVVQQYIAPLAPFLSPLTDASYVLVIAGERAAGVVNLERGVCNADKDTTVPTQNARTYAVLTQLSDKTVYCIDV